MPTLKTRCFLLSEGVACLEANLTLALEALTTLARKAMMTLELAAL